MSFSSSNVHETKEEQRVRRLHVKESLKSMHQQIKVESQRVKSLQSAVQKINNLFEDPEPLHADTSAYRRVCSLKREENDLNSNQEKEISSKDKSYPLIPSEMTKQMEHYKHGVESRFRVYNDGTDGCYRLKKNLVLVPVYKKL